MTSGRTRSSSALHGVGVGDVDAALVAIDADDVVALGDEVGGEMAPDEAERAGDEGLHWSGGRHESGTHDRRV